MRRCVIVGGADIRAYDFVRSYLRVDDFVIYCDSGLKHREGLGAAPDLIVGDFDSHENPHLPVETIVLPRAKDDTDSVFAVKEALRRGFEEFLLLGAMGARLDHTLANVGILLMLDAANKRAMAVDDYSEMRIVSREPAHVQDDCPYFSLLNVSGLARGVTIRGAKFPLEDGEITCEYQYATSNEVLPGQTAEITVKEGRLLLIEVRRP